MFDLSTTEIPTTTAILMDADVAAIQQDDEAGAGVTVIVSIIQLRLLLSIMEG